MQYRTEYPRPQLRRDSYRCLNGSWHFAIDSGLSLEERNLFDEANYPLVIEVPFCPESDLSGIGNKDFMGAVAYQQTFYIAEREKEILRLNFGACDYESFVYINKTFAGSHKGGYSSFSFEIQDYIREHADNTITVYVKDDNRSGRQPRGKQSPSYHSKVCDYTRTTGIWQTVWLEWVDSIYIKSLHLTPRPTAKCLTLDASLNTWFTGSVSVTVSLQGRTIAELSVPSRGKSIHFPIFLEDCSYWTPETPTLYDLQLSLQNGNGSYDSIKSYFGMRDISFDGKAFTLNGEKTFLRLILDQGFYKKGIYTAETEEELIQDIVLAKQAGFNGARLHQKIFEERFLYHCDRLGYLVFGEYPDAGLDKENDDNFLAAAGEWMECVNRDYSHPCIIGWCPLNETTKTRSKSFLRGFYELTANLDPHRPVIDASGFTHVITDIYDVHDYEQDTDVFARHMKYAGTEKSWLNHPDEEVYENQPYFVSEYGGIWWCEDEDSGSWGYGSRPKDIGEFYVRYERLTKTLLNNPKICGFCYTQLTDVEQEKNGIYTYDRKPKFDLEKIRDINSSAAAIEIP